MPVDKFFPLPHPTTLLLDLIETFSPSSPTYVSASSQGCVILSLLIAVHGPGSHAEDIHEK